MRDVATITADYRGVDATPSELLVDVLGWDVITWSAALVHWQRHATVDLTRSRALEIGAGESGGLSLWLALQGCDVLCSTPGHVGERVRVMHRRYGVGHRIRYASLDALELPDRPAFDVIAFKSVLGGIGTGEQFERQRRAIQRLHAALRPGGNLLFAENLAATRAHAALRARFGAGKDRWRYPTLREMNRLLEPFDAVRATTAGFVGSWGTNETQRRFSGAVDAFLCRWLVPASWQYVMLGVAIK
jgi:SAM-dependent methyltransferase